MWLLKLGHQGHGSSGVASWITVSGRSKPSCGEDPQAAQGEGLRLPTNPAPTCHPMSEPPEKRVFQPQPSLPTEAPDVVEQRQDVVFCQIFGGDLLGSNEY